MKKIMFYLNPTIWYYYFRSWWEGPSLWKHDGDLDPVTRSMTPELIADIEGKVQKWLDESTDPYLSLDLSDESGKCVADVAFWRSVVNLKDTANTWSQFHIAEGYSVCHGPWPRLISSTKKMWFGNNNSIVKNFKPDNEVLSENYVHGQSYIGKPEIKKES